MKKLLSLLLVLALLLLNIFSLASCAGDPPPDPSDEGDEGDGDGTESGEGDTDVGSSIVVPEYKDYGRGTVNFDELVYRSPNVESVADAFNAVAKAIEADSIPFEEQVDMIRELEDDYDNLLSMYTIARIYTSKNSASDHWKSEYAYISTTIPLFSQAVENMLVAAALSEHRTRFEDEYFGYSLEEYADGGQLSDELVALMAREAELEAEHSSISTATVEITYGEVTKTVDELLAEAKSKYGESSKTYLSYSALYQELYAVEKAKLTRAIFTELVKVRIQIADKMDADSYIEVGYDNIGHDYSARDMMSFISDISSYIQPVYNDLSATVFPYLYYTSSPKQDYTETVNDLYSIYGEYDSQLSDIFSYMLQHKLYDIDSKQSNRFEGAFTTYIDSNSSPFLFMTASGNITDYSTLAHELGHFTDGYVNNGLDASLDLSEVYSHALELLTLLELEERVSDNEYKYLKYSVIYEVFNILRYQSFYAAFEHLVYSLSEDEVTEARLNQAVSDAATLVFGAASDEAAVYNDLSYVLIVHTVEYPFYVQSYCTSMVAALEIFFAESETEGAGLDMFKALLEREDDLTFTEQLARVGIDSPFGKDILKEVANDLYRFIYGAPYFIDKDNGILVAA